MFLLSVEMSGDAPSAGLLGIHLGLQLARKVLICLHLLVALLAAIAIVLGCSAPLGRVLYWLTYGHRTTHSPIPGLLCKRAGLRTAACCIR